MLLKTHGNSQMISSTVKPSLRCPACEKIGVFDLPLSSTELQVRRQINLPNDKTIENLLCGMRICPNPACGILVFVIMDPDGGVRVSYPPETLDFDATQIPEPIAEAFKEAIICHAHECFIAAAIMVRKTLEELCKDRKAQGANLKERIQALRTSIVLPGALLEGLDELRLLGNDAAHIESTTFNNVGKEEVEVAIEFTKEILKAAYQYSSLLDRMRSLKSSK